MELFEQELEALCTKHGYKYTIALNEDKDRIWCLTEQKKKCEAKDCNRRINIIHRFCSIECACYSGEYSVKYKVCRNCRYYKDKKCWITDKPKKPIDTCKGWHRMPINKIEEILHRFCGWKGLMP